ncbi:MAG: DegT/DnrJ/EryC1/StrS family aminotransferase [Alphaproteobacteria bacterium]|nr:DegT/DnrJ/EryC1/StrS family aminotransferase [Alphaproteobacteria bacterium]
MSKFLPYSRQAIDEDDIASVRRALTSNFLTTGPEVKQFEQELQTALGVKYALTVNSGTAALHLAWRALSVGSEGLKAGDKVIVPSVTFLSAAVMAFLEGLELVFADCDPDNGLMSAQNIRDATVNQDNIRAICVVHLNGQFADMAEIKKLADSNEWKIIEDACHAMGGKQIGMDGKYYPIGACHYSDMTVFSLHAVKNITTGEGGIVTCNNDEWAIKMRDWRSHGMIRDRDRFDIQHLEPNASWYHEMHEWGMNYRISDIHAALGRSQLKKLDKFIQARADIFAHYREAFASLSDSASEKLRLLKLADGNGIAAWHLAVVLIDFNKIGKTRGAVMQELHEQGIGTQLHYLPIYRHRFFNESAGKSAGKEPIMLAGAETYARRALSLPIFYGMNRDDVARVVNALKQICQL